MTHSLILNPWGGSRLPDIRQAEAAECGLACLAMIAGYHGRHMDLATLRRRHPISVRGASLRSVMSMAAELDMAARPLRLEMAHLAADQNTGDPALGHGPLRRPEARVPALASTSTTRPPAHGGIPMPKPGGILPAWRWN